MSHPQAVVIWNGGAGSTEQSDHLREEIVQHPEIALVASDSREAAQQAVRGAVASRVPRIIAAGGDGTVSAVVDALADCDAATTDMAVLPLGTGNDLARTLGMPLQPDEALRVCLSGASVPMDVVRVTCGGNSRNVANMATAGNSGRYAQVLTDEQKKAWGPFCYLRGVLDVLQDLQVFDVECTIDNAPTERFRALNLFVANGRTSGGGVEVAPRAELADGMFDLVLIRDGSPLELATLTADYLLTSFLENDLVVWRRCRSLKVVSTEPLPFSADGDILGEAPALFDVRPAALRVVRGP